MTTIACNRKEMAGDSLVTDDYVGTGAFLGNKIHRIGSSLFGEAGENCAGISRAIAWLKTNRKEDPPDPVEDSDWYLLELSPDGIYVWDNWLSRDLIKEDTMAIGSGRKVALYCMRVLGYDPARSVAEAAKVDHHTRAPVISHRLTVPSKTHKPPRTKQ